MGEQRPAEEQQRQGLLVGEQQPAEEHPSEEQQQRQGLLVGEQQPAEEHPSEEPEASDEQHHAIEWPDRDQQDHRRHPRESAFAQHPRWKELAREVCPVTKNQANPVGAWKPQTESESHQKQHAAR